MDLIHPLRVCALVRWYPEDQVDRRGTVIGFLPVGAARELSSRLDRPRVSRSG